MTSSRSPRVDRRGFLATAARGSAAASILSSGLVGSGLVVGCDLFADKPRPIVVRQPGVPLNAWIVIASDDTVTFVIDEAEMGQGVLTALAMVLCEELDADWDRARAEAAVLDPVRYGYQGTAASTSIRFQEPKLRRMGATARRLLMQAASEAWNVPLARLATTSGVVVDKSDGRRATYGSLASRAAKLRPPTDLEENVELLPVKWRKLTGTSPHRLDTEDKITGRTVFGLDVRRPGQLYAAIARPSFGGSITSFDEQKAKQVPGVRQVVRVPSGVAVVAEHTWAALRGRDALDAKNDPGAHSGLTDAELSRLLADDKAPSAHQKQVTLVGQGKKGLGAPEQTLEVVLEVPLLAHACMEPLNATAHTAQGKTRVWAPTQAPSENQQTAKANFGIDVDDLEIHTTFLGGGFGRKSDSDFVDEAIAVSQKVGQPVQVVHDRTDDLASGQYRPCAWARARIGWPAPGPQGKPTVPDTLHLELRSVPILIVDGDDPTATDGIRDTPYGFKNFEVSWAERAAPVPVGFWRSVGHSQNAFFMEMVIDELAAKLGLSPLNLRLDLLDAGSPPPGGPAQRLKRVLQVATRRGYPSPSVPGRTVGIAAHAAFDTYVAQVAEVEVTKASAGAPAAIRVPKVTCAFDCGPQVIHPDNVRAQVESAIAFGLSSLQQRVELQGGRATMKNFDDFPVLRLDQMPVVDVILVTDKLPGQDDTMGGVGEPGLPPIAPAVASAVSRITGQRVRRLPIELPS